MTKPSHDEKMAAQLAQMLRSVPENIALDPETIERDLARLVLTLVEFLRRLLEGQALHRMERGTLSDEDIERLGTALMRAQQRISQLKDAFGLADQELNLDLGPLGRLL